MPTGLGYRIFLNHRIPRRTLPFPASYRLRSDLISSPTGVGSHPGDNHPATNYMVPRSALKDDVGGRAPARGALPCL